MSATLAELAALVNGQVFGDPEYRVARIGSLENAGADAIAFLAGARQRDALAASRAGAIILTEAHRAACAGPCVVVTAPHGAFARIAAHLHPDAPVTAGVHATARVDPAARVHGSAWIGAGAVIDAGAMIDERVYIGPLCRVGAGARIGADSRLDERVSVYRDCVLGQRCRLAAGAVIGADGFGYAPAVGGSWLRIPQTGRVVIGDEVDIGANATIDRGTMDDTMIGNGVKIDNQVQIAHNVQVGDHTIMAAKVGIAGSARIGRRCQIGGRASIAGHLTIVDDVSITATSMVSRSLLNAGEYSCTLTVIENTKWRKVLARIHRLQDLGLRLGALERRLNIRNERR